MDVVRVHCDFVGMLVQEMVLMVQGSPLPKGWWVLPAGLAYGSFCFIFSCRGESAESIGRIPGWPMSRKFRSTKPAWDSVQVAEKSVFPGQGCENGSAIETPFSCITRGSLSHLPASLLRCRRYVRGFGRTAGQAHRSRFALGRRERRPRNDKRRLEVHCHRVRFHDCSPELSFAFP